MKHVIIGNSAAGLSAVRALRVQDPGARITVLSEENCRAYSPVLTTHLVSGEVAEEALYLVPEGFYAGQGVEFLADKAVAIDVDRRQVQLASGQMVGYDRLLLATGARPKRPAVPGIDLDGVFVLRTLADARRIKGWIESGASNAVVVGGGPVGIKAAEAFRRRGLRVTLVVASGQVLSRVTDSQGAALVHAHLRSLGISVYLGAELVAIQGRGKVESVNIGSGQTIPADLVLIAKGVEPNAGLAREAGLHVGRGIVVDPLLRTSNPLVYAAGDVAEAPDALSGRYTVNALWGNAVEQGKIAGRNMAGANCPYGGSMVMNALHLDGLVAISMGRTNGPGTEAFSVFEPRRRTYRKLVLADGVVAGAVFIAPDRERIATAGFAYTLIRRRLPAAGTVDAILAGRNPGLRVYRRLYTGEA